LLSAVSPIRANAGSAPLAREQAGGIDALPGHCHSEKKYRARAFFRGTPSGRDLPMRRRVTFVVTLVLAGGLAAAYAAAADENKSGTEPGNLLPGPFHPYNVTGERKGKYHCLVCQYGLKPVVLIFTRESPEVGSPVTKLVKDLDAAIAEDQTATLRSGIVFLSEEKDPAALEKKLTDWAEAAKLKNVVVAIDKADDLTSYDLAKDAEVIVLVYDKLRVVKKHTFGKDKLTDKDAKAIVSEAQGLVEKKK
jgi:hypothetical protein